MKFNMKQVLTAITDWKMSWTHYIEDNHQHPTVTAEYGAVEIAENATVTA